MHNSNLTKDFLDDSFESNENYNSNESSCFNTTNEFSFQSNIFVERLFFKTNIFIKCFFFTNSKCNSLILKDFKFNLSFDLNENKNIKEIYNILHNNKIYNYNNNSNYNYSNNILKYIIITLINNSNQNDIYEINNKFKEYYGPLFGEFPEISKLNDLCSNYKENFKDKKGGGGGVSSFLENDNFILKNQKEFSIFDIPFLLYFIGTIDSLKLAIQILPYFYDAYENICTVLSKFYWENDFINKNNSNLEKFEEEEKNNSNINNSNSNNINNNNSLKKFENYSSPYTFLRDLNFNNEILNAIFHLLLYIEEDVFEYNILFYADYLDSILNKIKKTNEFDIKKYLKKNKNYCLNENLNKNKLGFYVNGIYTTTYTKGPIYKYYRDSPLNSSFSFISPQNSSFINNNTNNDYYYNNNEKSFISFIEKETDKIEFCLCSFILNLLGATLCKMNLQINAEKYFSSDKICNKSYSINCSDIFFIFHKIDTFFITSKKYSIAKLLSNLEILRENNFEFKLKLLLEYINYSKITLLQLTNSEYNLNTFNELIFLGIKLSDDNSYIRWLLLLTYEELKHNVKLVKGKHLEKLLNIEKKIYFNLKKIKPENNFFFKIENYKFFLIYHFQKLKNTQNFIFQAINVRSQIRKNVRLLVFSKFLNKSIYGKKNNNNYDEIKNNLKLVRQSKDMKMIINSKFKNNKIYEEFSFKNVKLSHIDKNLYDETENEKIKKKADRFLLEGNYNLAFNYYKKLKWTKIVKVVKKIEKKIEKYEKAI